MSRKPKIVVVGSLNIDVIVKAKRPPVMGETILGEEVHFLPGGKGANQAVAAARLGAEVHMVGAVGTDPFGDLLLSNLQESGVSTKYVKKVAGTATGLASILLANGDNSIIVVPGANSHCQPEDLEKMEEVLKEADVVLLQLEIPLKTVVFAVKRAKELGKHVVLNPAPARELPLELFQSVDTITPNETELKTLIGEEDPDTGMKRLIDLGVSQVVTTLGSKGAIYLTKDGDVSEVPAYPVKVVDTTGAGDAFNAGIAVALGEGKEIADAVSFAMKAAALSVTKLGAQTGMPTREEIENFFK